MADDIDGAVTLLTEDAWFTMPPPPLEYQGRSAIYEYLNWRGGRRHKLIPSRANGQPAFGCYRTDSQTQIAHAVGVLVLTLALYCGKNGYAHGIITLEVGLEAAIATGIAGLFVFARYYQILVAPATGQLGLGLGILSCFKILNDLFLQKFARAIGFNWNHASFCTFVAVLLVWMWALRKPIAMRIPNPIMKSAAAYSNLMPQVNQRLAELNEQLAHVWHLESPKS